MGVPRVWGNNKSKRQSWQKYVKLSCRFDKICKNTLCTCHEEGTNAVCKIVGTIWIRNTLLKPEGIKTEFNYLAVRGQLHKTDGCV
jgi:hypothetical protein